MRRCIDCLISSAKPPIASWYAALRSWADTLRHARTGIIDEYGTIPVSTGCALSALTCKFRNSLPKRGNEFCAAIIFMSYLQYRKSWDFCGISIPGWWHRYCLRVRGIPFLSCLAMKGIWEPNPALSHRCIPGPRPCWSIRTSIVWLPDAAYPHSGNWR